MDIDIVYPCLGLGEIKLGISENAVLGLLGNECEREPDEFRDVTLSYPALDLRLTFFHDHQNKLGIISTERKTTSFNEQSLWGKTKHEVTLFITECLEDKIVEVDGCEHEDGEIQEWIEIDKNEVSFWFLNDRLYLIDIFSKWDETDKPIWQS